MYMVPIECSAGEDEFVEDVSNKESDIYSEVRNTEMYIHPVITNSKMPSDYEDIL